MIIETKLAGNSDGYVHMLMLQVEKDRQNNVKTGPLNLKTLNRQFTNFQKYQQNIKLGGSSSASKQFLFNSTDQADNMGAACGNVSPRTPLQFWSAKHTTYM